jgi:hypothetical protein
MSVLSKLASEWNKRITEDARAAKRELTRYLMNDEKLLEKVLEEIVFVAVSKAVQDDIGHGRQNAWRAIALPQKDDEWIPPPDPRKQNGKGKETTPGKAIQKRYTNANTIWLDYPMANNVKLRHATKTMLEFESKRFEKLEGTSKIRKEFYGDVAKRMPDYKKQVGEVLTEGVIRRIAEGRQNILLEA